MSKSQTNKAKRKSLNNYASGKKEAVKMNAGNRSVKKTAKPDLEMKPIMLGSTNKKNISSVSSLKLKSSDYRTFKNPNEHYLVDSHSQLSQTIKQHKSHTLTQSKNGSLPIKDVNMGFETDIDAGLQEQEDLGDTPKLTEVDIDNRPFQQPMHYFHKEQSKGNDNAEQTLKLMDNSQLFMKQQRELMNHSATQTYKMQATEKES